MGLTKNRHKPRSTLKRAPIDLALTTKRWVGLIDCLDVFVAIIVLVHLVSNSPPIVKHPTAHQAIARKMKIIGMPWLGGISPQSVHFLGAWLSLEYNAAVLEVFEPKAPEQADAREVSLVGDAQYASDLCSGEQQLKRFSYSTSRDAMALG
jgi:hypothetical protein